MASTTTDDDIALTAIDRSRSSGYEESGRHGSHVRHWQSGEQESGLEQATLPRADGGKDAWMFLTGSFFIEALIWGE